MSRHRPADDSRDLREVLDRLLRLLAETWPEARDRLQELELKAAALEADNALLEQERDGLRRQLQRRRVPLAGLYRASVN